MMMMMMMMIVLLITWDYCAGDFDDSFFFNFKSLLYSMFHYMEAILHARYCYYVLL